MTVPKAIVLEPQPQQDAVVTLQTSPERWWLLVLLFTAMLISYAHRGALSVAVAASSMSEDLHLSEASIGVLLSAFFWIYAFTQVPAGWIVDRFGVRRGYSLGLAFWSLTSALTGFANGFAALVGLRVSLGAGQAICFPATSRAVANWFQERERGTVTGIYLTGVRFGTALVNFVGALFLARYSWTLFFIVIGIVPLVWLLPWGKFLGKWETSSQPPAGAKSPANSDPSFLKSLSLLKQRTILGIFLGFFAYDYTWFVIITWLTR